MADAVVENKNEIMALFLVAPELNPYDLALSVNNIYISISYVTPSILCSDGNLNYILVES